MRQPPAALTTKRTLQSPPAKAPPTPFYMVYRSPYGLPAACGVCERIADPTCMVYVPRQDTGERVLVCSPRCLRAIRPERVR